MVERQLEHRTLKQENMSLNLLAAVSKLGQFGSRCLSSLNCLNEYLAIDSGECM